MFARHIAALMLPYAVIAAAWADCPEQWLDPLPGPNNFVFALTEAAVDGEPSLYAGGAFLTAGEQMVNYIARWDGQQWHALGSGVFDDVIPWIYALHEYDGALIAGGQFSEAGGIPASQIAAWTGTHWEPLAGGVDGAVWALTEYEGDLIAGGHFTNADGRIVNHIARWDGEQWSDIAGGTDGPVFVLSVYGGELIAGGDFTIAGGTSANHIARWDGETWHPLGDGVDDLARAMLVHDEGLYVGGWFTEAGGNEANMAAVWDGESWSALGEGLGGGFLTPGIEALAIHNGNLIAGGNFTTAEGEDASRIARWNGQEWLPLVGNGVSSTVWALAVHNDALHAGGYFTSAGGESAPYWARWTINGQPEITEHPQDATAAPGGAVSFSVQADGDDLAYQWRRDGVALEDDDRISGANESTLSIEPVETADEGAYDVLVQNVCGTSISEAATLTVGVTGDLTGDGTVGVPDLLILINSWGPCPDCEDCPADLTGDCTVGVPDLLILIGNWG